MSEIIIALDFKNKSETKNFLAKFKEENLFVKVGMELFYREGISFLNWLKNKGYRIFLDLKIYDIPTTVRKTILQLNELPIDFLTIHLLGGEEMIKEAKKVSKIPLLGVTLLTSQTHSDVSKQITNEDKLLEELYKRAVACNLAGVICSVQDIPKLKEISNDIKFITPGIRQKRDSNDQKRLATPIEAKAIGSNYLVIGREITLSEEPFKYYKQIYKELENEK